MNKKKMKTFSFKAFHFTSWYVSYVCPIHWSWLKSIIELYVNGSGITTNTNAHTVIVVLINIKFKSKLMKKM